MKKVTLASVAGLLLACSLHAIPITWHFSGITSSSSTYNGKSIGGLEYEMRIFLDTDLVGAKQVDLPNVLFTGPFLGEVDVLALGFDALSSYNQVQYFAPVFSDLSFPVGITDDTLRLTAIASTVPLATDKTLESGVMRRNELFLSGEVLKYWADKTPPVRVPDATSTLFLLATACTALAVLRRRIS